MHDCFDGSVDACHVRYRVQRMDVFVVSVVVSICNMDWNMPFLVFTILSKVYMERMGIKYRMEIQRSRWRQNPMKR